MLITMSGVIFCIVMYLMCAVMIDNLEYRWYHYVLLFAGILLIYQLISMVLTAKLEAVTPAQVLKNRE